MTGEFGRDLSQKDSNTETPKTNVPVEELYATPDINFNGGLNTTSGPLSVQNNESTDLLNIDFNKFRNSLAIFFFHFQLSRFAVNLFRNFLTNSFCF